MPRRTLGVAIVVASALAIAAITLRPAAAFGPTMPFDHWCVLCGSAGAADFGANVLLFVPLGFGLVLAGLSWPRATLVAGMASASIELAQYLIVPGRFATLGDVLSNTTGAALGAALASHRRHWLGPRPRVAATLGALAGVGFVGVLAASAWLLVTPDEPASWSPTIERASPLPEFGWFGGTVRRAELNGFVAANAGSGPLFIAAPARRLARVDLTLQGGTRPRELPAPILVVYGPWGTPTAPWLRLTQSGGTTFTFEVGARERRFGLRQPVLAVRSPNERWWRFRRGRTEGRAAEAARRRVFQLPYALTATLSGDHVALDLARAGLPPVRSVIRLAPTLGWTLLSPYPTLESPLAGLATAVWLATLAAPMGYCARWAARGRRARIVAACGVLATVAAGLVAVPLAWRFSTGRWWEWVATVGGVVAGAVVAELVRRARRATAGVPSTR